MDDLSSEGVRRVAVALLTLAVFVAGTGTAQGTSAERHARVLVYGGGASLGYMEGFAEARGLELQPLDVDADVQPEADLVLLLWGGRGGRAGRGLGPADGTSPLEHLADALDALLAREPAPRVVASARAHDDLRDELPEAITKRVERDPALDAYLEVGVDRSNLRRLPGYLATTWLGRPGEVEAPVADVGRTGLYHPEHDLPFDDVAAFLAWDVARRPDLVDAPRALVLAVSHHFAVRNRDAVDALVLGLEARGVLVAAHLADQGASSAEVFAEFGPDVVLDTRHVVPRDEDREAVDAPFLQCATLTGLSIAEWADSTMSGHPLMGLETHELAGSIEPRVVNGARDDEGPEVFEPIAERVTRVVDRALAWIALRRTPVGERTLAISAGFGGGTPDEQLLDTPRSVMALLGALREHGWTVDPPADADALVAAWSAREWDGSQSDLARLVHEGLVTLVPEDEYLRWYEERVPAARRAEVEARWGPPPGDFAVVHDARGGAALAVPTLALGRVVLVGGFGFPPSADDDDMQAIRARMHESRPLVPDHAMLAARFLPEEGLGAQAVVRFGSFDSTLLMERRQTGLGDDDWPEILAGTLPDVRPFSLAATTFAIPARRRAGAVLVGYLTPPLEDAGLDDALRDLRDDVLRWKGLDDGALEDRFAASISEAVRRERLDRDLDRPLAEGELLSPDDIDALGRLLAEIESEAIPGASHVLGRAPGSGELAAQVVAAAGPRFERALATLCADVSSTDDEHALAERCVALALRDGLADVDALRALGVALPDDDEAARALLPDDVRDGLALVAQMRAGYARTGDELTNLVAALDGRFVPPGPDGTPERNPAALPSGRDMFFFDPDALPAEAAFDLGAELVDALLARTLADQGHYPRKVALSLSTKTSLFDHGVSEAEALWLLGVRPVRSRGRVVDVEVVPAAELGRPRIDVFVEAKHFYSDTLESRVQLIDRAIRMVAALDEPDNYVREGRLRARASLVAAGVADARADVLASARIFAVAPGRFGSGLHDELFEHTGVWETRADLAEVYMAQHDHVFTEGAWGETAPEAYRVQVAGSELVLRGSGNHGALTGRAHVSGASLANAIEQASGRAPAYYITDTRRPGREAIVPADEMLRRDLRAILFNGRWLAEMQDEGRQGAHRMSALTWKVLGFKVNVPTSVDDGTFEQIVDVFLRDVEGLEMPEFLERTSPEAMQEITKNLLEAARKGFWSTDAETLGEVSTVHAASVARHGLLLDENDPLARFVQETLRASDDVARVALADAYASVLAGAPPSGAAGPAPAAVLASPQSAPAEPSGVEPAATGSVVHGPPGVEPTQEEPVDGAEAPPVTGLRLLPAAPGPPAGESSEVGPLLVAGLLVLLACLFGGAVLRQGAA
ncbi:MAG: cobaltochelatase subunit CobN [Planctomycetes bacterium]|nr:cobaltochelatase subunit CobN [Planctomycetota bacterium]